MVVVVLLLVAGMVPLQGQAAGPAESALVVGTQELEIRTCPQPTCESLTKAPLGASVRVTGKVAAGYVPVEYEQKAGFAPEVYVAEDPEHVPFLLEGAPGCKRVALIFNVGVGFDPATSILDTLKREQVPATMFVMGWWADQHPSILKRMVKDGFPIGSHGYESIELPNRSDEEVAQDVQAAARAIEHATGAPAAPYFTPYASAIDERVRAIVAAEGFLPVAWEVFTADYQPEATADSVYDRIMDNVEDGSIVELHLDAANSEASTGGALLRVIPELRAQGYQFVTIPEMVQPCS